MQRRQFLQTATATLAAGMTPYVFTGDAASQDKPRGKNDRLRIGAVGMRYQGSVIAEKATPYGDIVAICDVDSQIAAKAKEQFGGKARLFEDYRQLLDETQLDMLLIGTPDHWHAKMVIDACRAGVDVYVEKPLTLTVEEGKVLTKVVAETGRVVQVGSWQRSDDRFRRAVELVRAGRLGRVERIDIVLGKNAVGGPFPVTKPPAHLNWELWQGQTPSVDYIAERCHYTFRWWLEYSGGQLTDWGAHHLDIGQWILEEYPVKVAGRAKYPDAPNGYNVPVDFEAEYTYPSGAVMTVKDHGENGLLITGTAGRIFVNRGKLTGKPVEQLSDAPLPRENYVAYDHDNLSRPPRAGKLEAIINHMGNFIDCLHTRQRPISDVASQHRSASICHLGNIAMRLGRTLTWNAEAERCVGDDEANSLLARAQRRGFEIA
jgi:predicted dehydrogenase